MEKPVRGYLGQHVNINIGLKYILKSKNACKYFSGLGPNKHGKGSYNILYVNKPLVVLGRTIHLSVFLKGTPGDHLLLYYCQQCHRWGGEAAYGTSPNNCPQRRLLVSNCV